MLVQVFGNFMYNTNLFLTKGETSLSKCVMASISDRGYSKGQTRNCSDGILTPRYSCLLGDIDFSTFRAPDLWFLRRSHSSRLCLSVEVGHCLFFPSPIHSVTPPPDLQCLSTRNENPQADENCGALGWRLSPEEMAALDSAAARL